MTVPPSDEVWSESLGLSVKVEIVDGARSCHLCGTIVPEGADDDVAQCSVILDLIMAP